MKENKNETVEDLKDEQINLKEYVYDVEDKVEIPAKMLEGLIEILGQVRDNEQVYGLLDVYPLESKISKNKEGQLESVDIKWQQYPNANSYFSQLSSPPIPAISMLGAMALDQLMILQQIHLTNIRSGKAKKVGTFVEPKNKENDTVKLS